MVSGLFLNNRFFHCRGKNPTPYNFCACTGHLSFMELLRLWSHHSARVGSVKKLCQLARSKQLLFLEKVDDGLPTLLAEREGGKIYTGYNLLIPSLDLLRTDIAFSDQHTVAY